MKEIDRLIVEEYDLKPNKYVARGMMLLFIILMAAWTLTNTKYMIFNPIHMNILVGSSAVLVGVIIILGYVETLASKPYTKYIIMSCVLIETFIAMVFLAQWVSIILIAPLLLASQYNSFRINWVTLIGTAIVTVVTPIISLSWKLWNIEYYMFLLRARGLGAHLFAYPVHDFSDYYLDIIFYTAIPRLAIVLALSTIMFSIVKTGRENIQNRMETIVLSKRDILTGLFNRLSYETRLEELRADPGEHLVCIYADVDGLHEVNNSFGHHIGDKMLITCADLLYEELGTTYRVGGDEFIAFVNNKDVESIRLQTAAINKMLELSGYHISFGIAGGDTNEDVDAIIRLAETDMYNSKRNFYEQTDHDRRRRRPAVECLECLE